MLDEPATAPVDQGQVPPATAAPVPDTPDQAPADRPWRIGDKGPRPASFPRNGGRPRKRYRKNPARRVDRPIITPRLSCFLTAENEIDFERTNDETVDRLRHAVTRPDALRRLGLVDTKGAPVDAPRSWGTLSDTLVDAVNAIGAQLAQNAWQLTDDQAAVLLLRRDPATRQQVSMLTGDLLDKYFPGGFGAYDKELSLLLILGGFVAQSVQQIKTLAPPSSPATVHQFPHAAADAAAPAL
jgi:hypothetical protein